MLPQVRSFGYSRDVRWTPITRAVGSYEKFSTAPTVPAQDIPIEEMAPLDSYWHCQSITEIQAVTFTLEPIAPEGLPNPPHCVIVWDQLEV